MKNYFCCNIKDYELGLTSLADSQTAHLPMRPHMLTEKLAKELFLFRHNVEMFYMKKNILLMYRKKLPK